MSEMKKGRKLEHLMPNLGFFVLQELFSLKDCSPAPSSYSQGNFCLIPVEKTT